MADKTKAVNLTEDEIIYLIGQAGNKLGYPAVNIENTLDRMSYLNKRLKTFKEPETETEKQNAKADNVTQGWGTGATNNG